MNLSLATKHELETVLIDEKATLGDVYYAKEELNKRNHLLGDLDTVIADNMGLVRMVVNKLYKTSYYSIDRDDLIQEGVIGMMRAYEKYDGRNKFSTYAVIWIEAKIKAFLRDKMPLIRPQAYIHELAGKIIKNNLESKKAEEIHDEIGGKLDRIERALELIHRDKSNTLSLDRVNSVEDNEFSDIIGKYDDYSQIEVNEFYETLTDRQRKALKMRLEGCSYPEMSRREGMTSQRWHFIFKDVGKKAKQYFHPDLEGKYVQAK